MNQRKSFVAWFNMVAIRILGYIQVFPTQPCFIILWGSTHYKLKGPEMRVILNALKPGDILLRRFRRYLTDKLIPGYYAHAGLYIGDNTVIHATTHDIFKEDILTFLRCDDIAVLRIKNLGAKELEEAVGHAKDAIGHGYDFDFGHSD